VSTPLRVILFARPLVRGTVKTRLEPTLGAEGRFKTRFHRAPHQRAGKKNHPERRTHAESLAR